MKKGATRKAVYRKEYKPYPWNLERAELRFEIDDDATRVVARLDFSSKDPNEVRDIVLDGENLELISVSLDGRKLNQDEYSQESHRLLVYKAPPSCRLVTEVLIQPNENTALEGLYPSGDFLLTQCEAEGFRKIT